MSVEHGSQLGNIAVSSEAIANLAGAAVSECYGVVGMASQKTFRDGLGILLRKDKYYRGVVVKKGDKGLIIDLYIIVSYGVKISAVVSELQQRVKYLLEQSLDQEFEAVNVFVQGVRTVD